MPVAGHEYNINCSYWRRLLKVMRIALADPLTAALAVLTVACNLTYAVVGAQVSIALYGAASSTTLTYMRLLSPRSPVRDAVEKAGLPANVTEAIFAFQDRASHAAKANLWWPPEPWTGVGPECSLTPPAEWSEILKLPANLWPCVPPNGYIPELGVVGSALVACMALVLLNSSVQLCGSCVIWRARLAVTRHVHRLLFAHKTLYDVVVLNPAIDNYDQRITDDLQTTLEYGLGRIFGSLQIAGNVSMVQSCLTTVFNLRLALISVNAVGGSVPIVFWALAIGASLSSLACYIAPMNRVSRLLFTQKKCEGDLRWLHCHLMEHSEAVAFYGGEAHEEAAADRAFGRVYSAGAKSFLYNSVLYAVGMLFTQGILPFLAFSLLFFGRFESSEVFTTSGHLTQGFAACCTVPQLYMLLSISGGPCHRIGVLLEALGQSAQAEGPTGGAVPARGWRRWLRFPGYRSQQQPLLDVPGLGGQGLAYEETRSIEVRGLCVAPPGSPSLVLFQGLTMTVGPGESTAIVGPSGSGKSSLLRVLAGLWPPVAGIVRLPTARSRGELFFLPQRCYVKTGTLQEQVTYPEAHDDRGADTVADVLATVGLAHLQQKWGLSAVVDWHEVLGAGEMQALGFARLLFHRPAFALMDEATSAMDLHAEARLMQLCEERGITAVSICHRPSAAGLHKRRLRYTGHFTGMDRDPASWRLEAVPQEDCANAKALVEAAQRLPVDTHPQPVRQARREEARSSEDSGGMGALFFSRFRRILRLSMPTGSCWAARCLHLILVANCFDGVFLITNTLVAGYILVDVSNLDATGGIYPERTKWLITYLGVVPVMIFTCDFVRSFCGQMLALHIRRCVTDAGHLLYFDRAVPYAINSRRDECLAGTAKWQPDQRLQQDAQKLCDYLASSLLGGATVNGVIGCCLQLTFGLIFACFLTWLVSSFVLALLILLMLLTYVGMLPVSGASVRLQRAEGAFRIAHARVREYAESIVFHGGQAAEARLLDRALERQVTKRGFEVVFYSVGNLVAGNMLGHVMAVVPVLLVSMVVFYWGPEDPGGSQITPQTLGSAQAFFAAILTQVGWLSSSFGGLGELAGIVHRIGGFLEAASDASAFLQRERGPPRGAEAEQDRIEVQNLTICGHAQCGDAPVPSVLVKALSLEVEAGKGLLITGDSGSGKSSLMRVLAGLHPPAEGAVKRPQLVPANRDWKRASCMFVPQASYAAGGSLRDEVAYPSAVAPDDEHVRAALEAVGLAHLEQRQGLGRAASWASVLSGGELQRLGLARVLYNGPSFALLDEATSALDAAMERRCLSALQAAGVTLVTVSHREGLRPFHSQWLRLAGGKAGGEWTLEDCGAK